MKKTVKSLRHALSGLLHAFSTEWNLIRFTVVYIIILAAVSTLTLDRYEWLSLVLSGGLFTAIELMNTAVERLVDTFDDYQKQMLGGNYHLGLKISKDVAAAASLISFLTVIATLFIVTLPHVLPTIINWVR